MPERTRSRSCSMERHATATARRPRQPLLESAQGGDARPPAVERRSQRDDVDRVDLRTHAHVVGELGRDEVARALRGAERAEGRRERGRARRAPAPRRRPRATPGGRPRARRRACLPCRRRPVRRRRAPRRSAPPRGRGPCACRRAACAAVAERFASAPTSTMFASAWACSTARVPFVVVSTRTSPSGWPASNSRGELPRWKPSMRTHSRSPARIAPAPISAAAARASSTLPQQMTSA